MACVLFTVGEQLCHSKQDNLVTQCSLNCHMTFATLKCNLHQKIICFESTPAFFFLLFYSVNLINIYSFKIHIAHCFDGANFDS